ncbi:MAG: hypothetical protein H6810_09790 [Phycisphaeraceae bacterium]|nr:MAG: hypothetical protein H6810_09790 [Phycisphaeraceae bacterium]
MRKIVTFVIAGTACGLASGQNTLDVERAYSAELAADAANRSSLLQGAGEGSGFSVTSGDGASTLNINALFQFRYVADFRDSSKTGPEGVIGNSDFTHGFEIPRARMDFSGNLVNDQITYRISADWGEQRDTTGANYFGVTWAYGQYAFESFDGAFIRWGQFKAPIFWEELVDPEFQLAGDRSAANLYFNQGYTQGIMFGYEADAWRGYFSVNDGVRTIGTNYNGAGEADIGLTARAEFKFAGDWSRFTDFTSWRNSDYAGKIGGAIHWETYGDTGPAGGASAHPAALASATGGDLILYTIDAAVEGNGWNVSGAFMGSWSEPDGAGSTSSSDFGANVQAGVFVTDQVELFGRWDAVFLDDNRFAPASTIDQDLHFLTFGVNYYVIPESHAVKASLELLWALNDNTAAFGILPGSGGAFNPASFLGQNDGDEVAVRGQVSVLF